MICKRITRVGREGTLSYSLSLIGILLVLSAIAAIPPLHAQEKINLRVATWQWTQAGFKEFFESASQVFSQKYPNLVIKPEALPKAEYFDKMIIETKAGNPPDIMMMDGILTQMMEENELEPLDHWLQKTDILKRWHPLQRKLCVREGKTYALLNMLSNWGMILYNQELFGKAGAKIPETPEEFLDAARKIRNLGKNIFGYGTTTKQSPEFQLVGIDLTNWVFAYGGNWVKDGKPTIDSPEVIRAVKFYKQIYDGDVTPKGLDIGQLRQMFWQERIGMIVDGPWQLAPTLEKNPGMYKNLGARGMVMAPGIPPKYLASSNQLAIPRRGKNKEEAWKFVEFIAQPEWQRKYLDLTYTTPGMVGVEPSPEISKKVPWLKTYVQTNPYADLAVRTSPLGKYEQPLYKIVAPYVVSVLLQKDTPEKAMAAAQKEFSDFLKEKGEK